MSQLSADVAAALATKLDKPKRFRIVSDEKAVARIERPLIRVSQKGFARLPEAPMAKFNTRFNIRVTSPLSDLAAAEDQLNDLVPEVLVAIEGLSGAKWTDAEKVMDPDIERLAYDIPLTIITRKD